jgi:glycosyltransferase involved in cell wall biosynthesis
MRFLLATAAHNANIQHIALALHEAGALGAYHTGCVDHYRRAWPRRLRRAVETLAPTLDRALRRRRISTVPEELIHAHWTWECARTVAGKLGRSVRLEDWLWERGELHLDRKSARLLETGACDAFFGVEHGARLAISVARTLGKKSVVAFLSPHHSVRRRWVDREYDRFPELMTRDSRRLMELARGRDARRDEEARLADAIYANSDFTARSLAMAGFPEERIITVPLGGPPVILDESLPFALPEPPRVVYAGSISVTKGAHYLIDAWKALGVRGRAQLHFYGRNLLPGRWLSECGSDVVWHDVVSQLELFAAFRAAAILVLPTLCDGFGSVVSEAMANGLPVITTSNAGAADLIEEGRNGFVVPPADSGSLGERIEWCLSHPRELVQMRRSATMTARRWTWMEFRAALRVALARCLGDATLATAGPLRRPA